MEAFQQHPQWQLLCPANGQDDSCDVDEQHTPSAEAAASQLVWAEYERLDWERIYAGETAPGHASCREGRLLAGWHHALLGDLPQSQCSGPLQPCMGTSANASAPSSVQVFQRSGEIWMREHMWGAVSSKSRKEP